MEKMIKMIRKKVEMKALMISLEMVYIFEKSNKPKLLNNFQYLHTS